jgi:hypothetical protein
MAKDTTSLSLAELEKLIEGRQAQVETLLKKRDQLVDTIEKLDAEIQDFLTTGGSGRRASKKRVKNESSLRTVVQDVLAKNKKGLSLTDLTQQVNDTGYKSHSRNFKNVVYQCLYHTDSIVHDESTGLYRVNR